MAKEVVYHPITGIPEEYNEYLPHDCAEYKEWAEKSGGAEESGKKASSSSGKEKKQLEVVIETSVRNKKKSVTSISGLEAFGIKLSEAAKACGKKFASGASVNKTPSGKEQIDIQGDMSYELPEFLMKLYKDKGLKEGSFYQIVNKKKQPFFDAS